ncbi:MAG TPA: thioesterase family protein [Polyangia bacterium]|jgi:acyl-CoA thioester hydrolase
MEETRRSATVQFSVPFCDVDAMQVVWHGNYYKYFDIARDRLFSDAGIDLYQLAKDGGVVFPITRTQTKHILPLRFRDEVECKATLVEAECRLVVEFELRLAGCGKLCAKGRTEQAAVCMEGWTLELRLPDFIRRALGTLRDNG